MRWSPTLQGNPLRVTSWARSGSSLRLAAHQYACVRTSSFLSRLSPFLRPASRAVKKNPALGWVENQSAVTQKGRAQRGFGFATIGNYSGANGFPVGQQPNLKFLSQRTTGARRSVPASAYSSRLQPTMQRGGEHAQIPTAPPSTLARREDRSPTQSTRFRVISLAGS